MLTDPMGNIMVSTAASSTLAEDSPKLISGKKKTVFAGKDPSRALATSSLSAEDCVPEWSDLEEKYQTVLEEWFIFFSKRYNIVGKVQAPTNS